MVRDGAVRVHEASIGAPEEELAVVVGVVVLLRVGHVPESGHGVRRDVDVFADRPVGARGLSGGADAVGAQRLRREELGTVPDHVREGLVERARLVAIDEVRGALRHRVRVLVRDDVQTAGELTEDDSAPVAEDDHLAVPERVVVALRVMRDHVHPAGVAVREVEALASEVVVVGHVAVVLSVHERRLAGRGPVGCDEGPVVVGVGRGRLRRSCPSSVRRTCAGARRGTSGARSRRRGR